MKGLETMKVKTSYLAATDTRGERIRVTAQTTNGTMQLTVPWDYSQNNMHTAAVQTMLGNVTIEYRGDHRWGKIYEVTPNTPSNANGVTE